MNNKTRPVVAHNSPFKCQVCKSPYFGPLYECNEHVGRYCKGWPTGFDRSYYQCTGQYEESFDDARAKGKP